MRFVTENAPGILQGFAMTLALFAVAAIVALALGFVLALMRVLPVLGFRVLASLYVNVFRNVPPILVFFIVTFGLPEAGVRLTFFTYAVISLALYEAALICEAMKAGLLTVARGQVEAARAIGMGGGQVLGNVILPQALATAIPPVGNCLVGLSRATALAGAFGVVEATTELKALTIDNPGDLWPIFLSIAAGYVAINVTITTAIHLVEQRVAVLR